MLQLKYNSAHSMQTPRGIHGKGPEFDQNHENFVRIPREKFLLAGEDMKYIHVYIISLNPLWCKIDRRITTFFGCIS